MCSTPVVGDTWWHADLFVGGEWHTIGVWSTEVTGQEPAAALRWWLDHHDLPDATYRVHDGSQAPEPAAPLHYRRAVPLVGYRRHGRDEGPYVCPHCGAQWTERDHRPEWIYQYCSQCHRYRDGCRRLGYEHAPPSSGE